jgi:hypothetical protein
MRSATRRIVASSLVALAVESPSFAASEDTFRAEAGLSYSRLTADGVRQNTPSVEATYFFDGLPTLPKDYPLEQAQFVERVSSLSAHYGQSSFQIDNYQSLSRGSMYGVAALFTLPDTPFIAGAAYDSLYSGKLGGALSPTISYESEADTKYYQLSVGAYVAKTTALSLDWARSRNRDKLTYSDGTVIPDVRESFASIGFSGQHLSQLSGSTYIATIASVGQTAWEPEGAPSRKNLEWFLQATYYPAKTLGLTLGVSSSRGDIVFSEGETYLAGARMFITPTVSLSLDFQQSHAKAPNSNDYDFVMLRALVRF